MKSNLFLSSPVPNPVLMFAGYRPQGALRKSSYAQQLPSRVWAALPNEEHRSGAELGHVGHIRKCDGILNLCAASQKQKELAERRLFASIAHANNFEALSMSCLCRMAFTALAKLGKALNFHLLPRPTC